MVVIAAAFAGDLGRSASGNDDISDELYPDIVSKVFFDCCDNSFKVIEISAIPAAPAIAEQEDDAEDDDDDEEEEEDLLALVVKFMG
uniref:Bm14248 n=1 Tax=Brugia malayi TaxID=6279 RepID=A0A1I9G6Z8_BRUMA|nr:Bm14248 [Brugia malayi]